MGECIHIATFVELDTHYHGMVQTANTTGVKIERLERMAKDLSVLGWPLEDCMDAVCQLAFKRSSRDDIRPSGAGA